MPVSRSVLPLSLRALLLGVVVGVLVFALSGCVSAPAGKRWWNPTTWWSDHALTAKQAAQGKEEKAAEKVDLQRDQVVHASHVEFSKANIVLGVAEQTPDTVLARRFVGGGIGLLNQVDPLTAKEDNEIVALVADLRSGDHKRVAAALDAQAETERRNIALAEQLKTLQRDLDQARAANKAKDQQLADAFMRENELANTLRNMRLIAGAGIVGTVLLAGLCLYLRMGLGSVGAGLSGLHKLIGQEAASKVISNLDANTDWLHQIIVGAGRKAADSARAKALSDTVHTTA